jgi:hypothetical protein
MMYESKIVHEGQEGSGISYNPFFPRFTISLPSRGFQCVMVIDSEFTKRYGWCESISGKRCHAIVAGKLNTRNGQVRTAALAATPPIIKLKNERLSMTQFSRSLAGWASLRRAFEARAGVVFMFGFIPFRGRFGNSPASIAGEAKIGLLRIPKSFVENFSNLVFEHTGIIA